jgi:hypothetical protein
MSFPNGHIYEYLSHIFEKLSFPNGVVLRLIWVKKKEKKKKKKKEEK